MDFVRLKAYLRKRGNMIDDFDLLIGATAIANGLILGMIAQVIYLALLSRSITGILETKSNGFLAMMSMIFDLLVIVIVLLAGFLFKDNINYWGIFIGLVFDKVIYLILNLRR